MGAADPARDMDLPAARGLLMPVDRARGDAGEAAGVEQAAGLRQRGQELGLARLGEGVVPLAGTWRRRRFGG